MKNQDDTDSQGMGYLSSLPRRAVTLYLPLAVFVLCDPPDELPAIPAPGGGPRGYTAGPWRPDWIARSWLTNRRCSSG